MTSDRLRKAHRFATVPEHLIRDKSLSHRAFRLWCILDRYAGANDTAFPLRKTLADDLDCSVAQLDREMKELVAGGWLHKERRAKGDANIYTLLVAKVPTLSRRRSVREGGVVKGEDTPVLTDEDTPVLVGEDRVSSPTSAGVLTGDAQKEESSKEASENEGSTSSRPRGRSPEKPLPADFHVTDSMKAWFAEQEWKDNVTHPGAETQAFMEHARANDRRQRDWVAAWRTWMIRAGTTYATNAGGGRQPTNLHTTPDTPGRQQRLEAWS